MIAGRCWSELMSGKFVSPLWAMTLVVGAPAKLAHAVPASRPMPNNS